MSLVHSAGRSVRIAIVADYDASFLPHRATDDSLAHVRDELGIALEACWVGTEELVLNAGVALEGVSGVLVGPGSPYKSMRGALEAIRYCREAGTPLLGTCGGCQHVVIEYARNVLGIADAAHAEYDPYASNLFVTPLSRSLVGKAMSVVLEPGCAVANVYGATEVTEQYYCNFAINPLQERALHEGGLRIAGRDLEHRARVLLIPEHPFFVGAIFVPQLTSTRGRAHPLITAFVSAAHRRSRDAKAP